MRTITTNQVKTFVRNNPYAAQYLSKTAYESHKYYPKMGRNVDVTYENGRLIDLTTHQNNVAYCLYERTLKNKFPELDTNIMTSFKIEDDYCDRSFGVNLRMNSCGSATVYVRFCSSKDGWYHQLPFAGPISEYPSWKYNGRLDKKSIAEFARKKFEAQFLYAKGFFRDIQLRNSRTKEDAKRIYKYWSESGGIKTAQAYDDSEMLAWLKRHKNVKSLDIDVTLEDALNMFRKHPALAKPMHIARYDGSWVFDFDGDIDEIENEFYSHLQDDTLYI